MHNTIHVAKFLHVQYSDFKQAKIDLRCNFALNVAGNTIK